MSQAEALRAGETSESVATFLTIYRAGITVSRVKKVPIIAFGAKSRILAGLTIQRATRTGINIEPKPISTRLTSIGGRTISTWRGASGTRVII